eukprot:06873.XXX_431916_432035_1 [CDS] Oithona nana genome sequencing.
MFLRKIKFLQSKIRWKEIAVTFEKNAIFVHYYSLSRFET